MKSIACRTLRHRPAYRGALILLLMSFALAPAGLCNTLFANDFGANGDGRTLDTPAIQRALDSAERTHATVTFKPGTYLTGSLFVRSGTTLDVPTDVTLIGSEQLADYPMLPTRIAGIEMTWPAALINARDVAWCQHHRPRNDRRRRAGLVEELLGPAKDL